MKFTSVKVSNNALNFLLAQYRAIFKRAYIKGIASAVLLTAGLAAGASQANAAAPDPAKGEYYQYEGGDWSVTSGATSDVDGIVAASVAKQESSTTSSGAVLTIGGDVANSLQTVTSGTVAGGWASFDSGNAFALSNEVKVLGSGSVTREGATAGTRGSIIGGYAKSAKGKAEASGNIISVAKGETYRDKAATSHGFMGGKAQGLTGATANNNKVSVKGAPGSLQTLGVDHLHDVVGGYVMTAEAPTASDATGDYVANENIVDLQYVKAQDLTSDNNSGKDASLGIYGGHFSVYTDNAITASADQNIVKITASEFSTANNSSGTHVIAGVRNRMGDQNGVTTSLNFTNNAVTLADTKITNGTSFTGSFTVAGAYATGLAPSITTTDNSVTLTETGTTNTLAISDVAGAYVNSSVKTANGLTIEATGNKVEVGENVQLTGDVAGASITASGSAIKSLNASGNSVVVKGTVSGSIAAVTYDKASSALAANAVVDFSHNSVTLSGAKVSSGSITGGTGLDSAILIDKDSVYNVTAAQDLASDVINIAGKIDVASTGTLDISGFYQNGDESSNKYNANLTTVKADAQIVNSGTINVYGKMVVEDEAVLTAGKSAAAIIVNGAEANQNTDQAPEDVVAGAGFGHLVIAKDTLQGYLKGEAHSGALILSDATLEFSGTEEIDLAKDFTLSGGAATASGNGIITVSGSTIKGEYLKVSDTLAQVTKDTHGLVLDATNLTLGSSTYNKTASFGFDSATAQNLTLQASGSFTLADDITLKAVTGTKGNFASSAGSITAKDVVISGGSLNVVAGDYSSATLNLDVDSGDLTVGAKSPDYFDANGAAVAAQLGVTNLTVGEDGTATVAQNGSLTATKLTTMAPTSAGSNGLIVDGKVSVSGKYDSGALVGDASDDNYGLTLASGSITVNKTGVLTFGADATKAIKLDTASADNQITVDSDIAAGAIVLSGGEVQFAFTEDQIFDEKAVAELRKELFNSTTPLNGFVNLGAGKLDGLTFSGSGDNLSVAWDDLEGYSDIIADFTTGNLQQATVTGIESGDPVQGSVGSLQSAATSTNAIGITGNTTLNSASGQNNAFASNANNTVIGVSVANGSNLTLKNGGAIGEVSFTNGGNFVVESVASTAGEPDAEGNPTVNYGTTIAAIRNADEVTFSVGSTEVTGRTEAEKITTAAGTEVSFGDRVTTTDAQLLGTTSFTTLETDRATFTGGEHTITSSLDVTGALDVTSGAELILTGASLDAGAGLTVDGQARITVQDLITSGALYVGTDGQSGDSGFLDVTNLTLNGNNLIVDPEFGKKASLALIEQFADKFSGQTKPDAGYMKGNVYVLKNSIVAIGSVSEQDVLDTFEEYINQATGSLIEGNTGSIAYVANTVTIGDGYRLVVDPTVTNDAANRTFDQADYSANGLTIKGNGALAVDVGAATGTTAAITFENANATVEANTDAKILLTGKYAQTDTIKLFADGADGKGEVTVKGEPIQVQTINGLLAYEYKDGTTTFQIKDMTVQTERARSAFAATSSPVHHSLVAYGTGYADWDADTPEELTHGALVAGAKYDSQSKKFVDVDGKELAHQENYIKLDNPAYVDNSKTPGVSPTLVYLKADNAFLSAITNQENNDGSAAESAARMADFAGVAQVALKAGASTYEAISGRMGMGAENTSMTFANNGQGAGIWLTPIYQTSDSDGFEAQGVDYGADIDLYGIALGGDYTLANGVRVGAMFNVGSGEADGQGAGSAVSNDFDYYGFGLYAGYTVGQFSVVGDVSYTAVDNDVEANTNIDKLETSLDSSNLSLGVTGAYAFETAAGIEVTPHVGLRYSYIDIDDYSVQGKTTGTVGDYSADSLSVFSIPVGVTIASEFQAGSWSVKPSFDITLTGNFGDDENEGTFHWTGVENIDSSLTSEIFDNFTYGASLGVAAQSTSGISLGLTVGYTGSSNVDDLGVSANARFTF